MTPTQALAAFQPMVTGQTQEAADPQAEANKKVVARLFLEIVNQKAYEVAGEIFAPDFHWPQFDLHGPEGVCTWARAFHAGWPDVADRIELQIAQGDWVMSLVSVYGTQSGTWAGFPPSGKAHAFPAVGIDRLRDGRIVERFALFDMAGVAGALGHSLPITSEGPNR